MATFAELTLYSGADQTVLIDINDPETFPPGEDVNLTGLEIDFYIKVTAETSDTAPSTVKLSTTGGDITISTAPNHTIPARATVSISKTVVPTGLFGVWRCDVLGAKKVPCGYGPCNILPM